MRIDVKVDLNIDTNAMINKIRDNDAFWLYAATEWHRLYKKYVPFKTGVLRDTVVIEPKQITHTQPYAHYQYTGEVYGPNYPIVQNGVHVGYFSTPNRKKHPTGKTLKYKNPLASKEWDKRAEATQKASLISSLQKYIDEGRLGL